MGIIRKIAKIFSEPKPWHKIIKKSKARLSIIKTKKDPKRFIDTFHLEVSSNCNLSCMICSNKLTDEAHGIMESSTFEHIEKKIFPYAKSVTIRGIGEPLLNPDLVEIIKRAKNNNLQVNVTSNFMLFTEEIGKQLILSGLDSLGISIDGPEKESYEEIRKRSNFEKLITNITLFLSLKHKLKRDNPFVSLSAVLMKSTVKELKKFLSLTKTLGLTSFNVQHIFTYSKSMDETFPIYYDSSRDVIQEFNDAKQFSKDIGIEFFYPILQLRENTESCSFNPSRNFVVSWEGNIRPCCILFHSYPRVFRGEEQYIPSVIFGNIIKQEFLEIWQNPDYLAFKARVSNKEFPEECKFCLMRMGIFPG